MISLHAIRSMVVNKTGRPLLMLSKLSPEILLGVGIVGVVATVVLASKATLKVETILDDKEEKVEKINGLLATSNEEVYSDEDAKKDMGIVYVQTGYALLKLYAPAIIVGVISVGLLIGSHGILQKRNLAAMAAYKVVHEGFEAYRKRVVEQLGPDKDREFRYGITKEKVDIEELDEHGKYKKVKATRDKFPDETSIYAKYFDDFSSMWTKSPENNLFFLKNQQSYFNDVLSIRGHVFLNEVYHALGIPHTQDASIVGWIRNSNETHDGDGFISFGIYDLDQENSRAFVNGYTDRILLDFNVDGIIWNLI